MRKAVLFGLVLILLLSNTSARSHYVILAPVGTRIQYPLNPGYVLGFQDFSYFWGHGNVKNNNTNHGSYIPLRYVPRFSVGGTENDSTERTMGLHFALDLSSASYYNYNNDKYKYE